MTRELARALVGLVDEVRVSMDALAERNDRLRGTGSYEAALRALDTLLSVGFEPKVLTAHTSVSAPDLEELVCLLLTRGITRINANAFRPLGRGAGHSSGWFVPGFAYPDTFRFALGGLGARGLPELGFTTHDFGRLTTGRTDAWYMSLNNTGAVDARLTLSLPAVPFVRDCPGTVVVPAAGSLDVPLLFTPTSLMPGLTQTRRVVLIR